MEKILDLKNLPCPGPVIETKKVLENQEITKVISYVDNPVAKENLLRLGSSLGVQVSFEEEQGIYKVILEKGTKPLSPVDFSSAEEKRQGENQRRLGQEKASGKADHEPDKEALQGTVYFITSDEMGKGDQDLGRLLMKGFLYTLTQLSILPQAVVMVNSGVRLSCENPEAIEHLKTLEAKGVKIISCGTCLNFYHLTEHLQAGTIGNMYDIVEELGNSVSVTV